MLASLPFIASGHIGIPGVGLNNDMAMHLIDTDYLLDPHGPQPQSFVNGYPIGPHSLVATVVNLLGTEPLQGWLGLLLAAPILTAITSLGLLRELAGWRHILGAALVGLAYLTASVLGIAGFKELIAGMFLIAFAIGLREIERESDGRIAIVIGLALITAAMIPVYSLPGVAWLAITAGLWVLAHLLRIRAERGPEGVRQAVRASLPIVIPAAIVLLLVGLVELPKILDFLGSGSIGNVADTNSKLRYVVSPLETLGIWPSGNWLLGTHDFSHDWLYWLFGLIGLAGLIIGFAWWIGRRDFAVPAAVVSGFVIYLLTKYIENGGLYILAKAVVVPASIVMLLAIMALLAPGGGPAKRVFAVVFIALAAYSSFLALRDTIVASTGRLDQLAEFRGQVAGQSVLALTSDRFTDYALRTATVSSPAYNSEIRVPSTGAKTQRLPIDFDSVPFDVLNQFPYAVTTSAVYQSQAPPGWTLAASNSSYRLWKRTGTTPNLAILAEEARPGRVFRCKNPKFQPGPRGRRRGGRLAPAGDRQAALLEGGHGRRRRHRGRRQGRQRSARQQPRAGADRQPDDQPAAGAVEALHPVREPGDRHRGEGARPRDAPPLGNGRRDPLPARPGPLLARRRVDEQGRADHGQRPGRRRQLAAEGARGGRAGGDREPDRRQPRRLPEGRHRVGLRALRRPHHRRQRAEPAWTKDTGPASRNPAGSSRVPKLPAMKVGVVGLGYVGLPLAVAFAQEGNEVVGLDADPRKIDALAENRSYIEDVPSERLAALDGSLTATSRFADLSSCDAVIICVPTPLTNSREPDLSYMIDAATSLAAVMQKGQLVVLESTTYPGTTRERLRPILEESGLAAGRDFHLAFSPERIDPGRTDYTIRTTPKVVGGLNEESSARAVELYKLICDEVVEVSNPDAAELTKLLENIFRSVNIALVNELAMLCERLDVDVWEVVEAAASKPFGFMRFDPGPGMGGHCLPVDPFYLSYKAREHDFYTEFIELAGKINQNQPQWCVRRIERALNSVSKATNGSKVLMLGVSYKAGVGDIRESPALKMIHLLRELGADVSYHDPHVPELIDQEMTSAPLEESLAEADLVCIVTAHPSLDYGDVVERSSLVLDFRGVTREIESEKLVLL